MGRLSSLVYYSCLLYTTVFGSVVGIDLGYGHTKAAIIQSGRKPAILLNETSSRSSPSAVYLNRTPRSIGSDAYSFQTRDPMGVVVLFHRLLGKDCTIDNNIDLLPMELYSYDIFCDEETKSYKLRVDRDGGMELFPEEYLAYLIQYYKDIAINHIENENSVASVRNAAKRNLEFAFAVPWGLNHRERAAYKVASDIAGIKLQVMYPQIAAAAGYHSIDIRKTVTTDVGSTKIIVDAGSLDTVACLVHYKKSSATVVVKKCNKALNNGGMYIDIALMKKILKDFEATHGTIPDNRRHRSSRELLTNINKVKHVLSVNKTGSIRMENVDGRGNNLNIVLTREELEDIVTQLDIPNTVTAVIRSLLPDYKPYTSTNPNISITYYNDDSKEKNVVVDAIELIGGSWRVPIIQKNISQEFPNILLATTINPDEGPALGAAYALGATKSYLKVPPLRIDDSSNPHIYEYSFTDGEKEKRKDLVANKSLYQFKKLLKIRSDKPNSQISIIEDDKKILHYECNCESAIDEYKDRVKKIEDNIETYKEQYLAQDPDSKLDERDYELSFHYEINFGDLGLPLVKRPYFSYEYSFLKPVVSTTTTTTTTTESTISEAESDTVISETEIIESTDIVTSTETETDKDSEVVEDEDEANKEKKILKLMNGRKDLPVDCTRHYDDTPIILEGTALDTVMARFSSVLMEDQKRIEFELEKNNYESLLYNNKNLLYESDVIRFYGQDKVDLMEEQLIEYIDQFDFDGYDTNVAETARQNMVSMLKEYMDTKTTTTTIVTTSIESTDIISESSAETDASSEEIGVKDNIKTVDKQEL